MRRIASARKRQKCTGRFRVAVDLQFGVGTRFFEVETAACAHREPVAAMATDARGAALIGAASGHAEGVEERASVPVANMLDTADTTRSTKQADAQVLIELPGPDSLNTAECLLFLRYP